jgi:pyrimidine-nucleoside phosphorylase
VPTLAVPGRPAGGVDALAQISGYRVDLQKEDVEAVLRKCGYAHIVASHSFAPLDALLFSHRRKRAKVNIPELAIASLLAKTSAAGVSLVGLDVRIAPHGNFGATIAEALSNSGRFCRIASLLGCKAVCFLTDATRPYQPFIGRGEALLAMWKVMEGTTDGTLKHHNDACYAMAGRLAYLDRDANASRPSAAEIRIALRDNVEAQGASIDALEARVQHITADHRLEALASDEGFLHVDLDAIRAIIVERQAAALCRDQPFPDPCGIVLRSDHGDFVRKGDCLATLRCPEGECVEFRRAIVAALSLKPYPVLGQSFVEVSRG